MGLRMLDGFVYKDNQWVDGTIYNPKREKPTSATCGLTMVTITCSTLRVI